MIDNDEGADASSAWPAFGAAFIHPYDVHFNSKRPDKAGAAAGAFEKGLGDFGSAADSYGASADERELLGDTRVKEIPLNIEAVIGRARIPVAELLTVSKGQVIRLDRHFGDPVEIRVNGQLIGRGEIVADDDDNFIGIRMTEILRD